MATFFSPCRSEFKMPPGPISVKIGKQIKLLPVLHSPQHHLPSFKCSAEHAHQLESCWVFREQTARGKLYHTHLKVRPYPTAPSVNTLLLNQQPLPHANVTVNLTQVFKLVPKVGVKITSSTITHTAIFILQRQISVNICGLTKAYLPVC